MTDTKILDSPDEAAFEELRQSLVAKRDELVKLYRHDVRVGQESTDDNADDFADRANNSYNRELMFTLSDSEREALLRVEDAFKRLDSGQYGSCEHCGRQIGLQRLRAVPWTHHCISCQELEEKGMLED